MEAQNCGVFFGDRRCVRGLVELVKKPRKVKSGTDTDMFS
jgi:hypothetical protein